MTEAVLIELAVAGLQIFNAACRAAGMTAEEKAKLYEDEDQRFMAKSDEELPDPNG